MTTHPHRDYPWPAALFSSPWSAPLWLVVRLHLASVWLQFGVSKVRDGWLTRNAAAAVLDPVAQGATPAPFEEYRVVVAVLLDLGVAPWLSVGIPLAEIGVGLAFVLGVGVVNAAVLATVLNLNLVLSGLASWLFDGRVIALQLLMIAAWPVVERIGVRAAWERLRRLGGRGDPLPV